MCCCGLQCTAMCYCVQPSATVCCTMLKYDTVRSSALPCVAVHFCMLQWCSAVCCSVAQYVAVLRSMLQCVAVGEHAKHMQRVQLAGDMQQLAGDMQYMQPIHIPRRDFFKKYKHSMLYSSLSSWRMLTLTLTHANPTHSQLYAIPTHIPNINRLLRMSVCVCVVCVYICECECECVNIVYLRTSVSVCVCVYV